MWTRALESLSDSLTMLLKVAPKVAAADYTSSSFPTPEAVIAGAIYMMARELSREPAVSSIISPVLMRPLNFR